MILIFAGSVPFGAAMPRHWPRAKSTPCSMAVGTSLKASIRFFEKMARGRRAPDSIWATPSGGLTLMASTWPPTAATIVGPPPLCGTWLNCTPAAFSKASTIMWVPPPAPALPIVT